MADAAVVVVIVCIGLEGAQRRTTGATGAKLITVSRGGGGLSRR